MSDFHFSGPGSPTAPSRNQHSYDPLAGGSRPTTPGGSFNNSRASSQVFAQGNASSAYLLEGDIGSSVTLDSLYHGLPQNPQPAFVRRGSTTSSASFEGSTACPTPMPHDEKSPLRTIYNHNQSTTSFHLPHDPRLYKVETIHKHDDVELLSNFRRTLYRLSPLFTLLAVGSYFLYYAYRIHCTIISQQAYGKTYVMAWLFIAAEGCVACPALLHQLYQMLSIRGRSRPRLRLVGDDCPTIDVFITCCGEDVDVVLDTTRAACAVDYPKDRFRVVVLDDGKDENLQAAVENLSSEYPNCYYYARIKIKGVPHHFKAGNLTGGTDLSTKLPGGCGEYIAALDADMIPEPDWLRAIVPHLIQDDKMALVCPPQLFYNIPDNDPLVQSLDTFVHVMEPTKDANGVAWCTGSGYLIRRAALEDIGGWPVGSLAEDTFTSSLLLGSGWKTAFCHEALQYGTVPETFTGHLKQRTRWTLGTLQTALKLKFCLFGDLVKGMSFFARLSAFVFAIDAFFKIFLLMALLTIPIVLISGGQLVAYSTTSQLRWQLRLCFISLVLTRLNEWITYLPSGYRLAQRDTGAQMWMAPYHAMTIIRSFILPTWLGGKTMAFSSSGSVKSELNERDPATRAPLYLRLKVFLWDCDVYLHLLYILFVVAAVTLSTVTGVLKATSVNNCLVYLMTHAFWPPCLWLIALSACATPIRYCIFPPTMPDREDLLDRDPKTGIARPKEHWKKQRYAPTTFWHELQYSTVTVYTIVLFFGSFFVKGIDLTK
ncbi:hypothetical protein BP5796_06885 [Coleophoma crateriformis]|uniref:Glycosyltransferase 2-like domain-containing protein n=1 Tax=Coleophoma crateriformis TaxID=565419 RepID=A0A3D8RQA4_9HELO|nr:hypothetical protein BP5796_06885 [Coleophoma crateriformis]